MAPNIFDVTVTMLASPATYYDMVAKKIAERAKAERGGQTATEG